jgi:DNA repair protein RecN (Recombination protein N)
MLCDLHIEDIAVIHRADISFTKGLNVLTGETGAGKSIIIDALSSVLGARTSRELVRSGADKALVTASFESSQADKWLEENEIETDGELILQRRITPEGKTGAKVCGAPVTGAQLRVLAGFLLDIHGQNDGRKLMDEGSHRQYLDDFGDYPELIESYKEAYAQYRATEKSLKSLSMDELEKERLSEKLRAAIYELESAELREGETEALMSRRELLRNAEKLTEAVNTAYEALYSGDSNAVSLTQEASYYAGKASEYCRELEGAVKSLNEAELLLKDAAETIGDTARSLDFSPEEYDALETRYSFLRHLSKRYGADEAGLIRILEDNKRKLEEIEYSDERVAELKKLLSEQRKQALSLAAELTESRKLAAKNLERRIEEELLALNMPSVRFVVDITSIDNGDGFPDTLSGPSYNSFFTR